MSILFKNVDVVTLDGNYTIIKNGFVGIYRKKINYVGEIEPDKKYSRVIDGAGKVVMPGLVNAHTHSAMTLLRGFADDMNLQYWLTDKVWPVEGRMTEDDVYWGSALAIIEMIKSGTIAFADMYFYSHQMAKIAETAGVYANIGATVMGNDDNCGKNNFYFNRAKMLHDAFNGTSDGKIKIEIAPHAVYTCSENYLCATAELAEKLNVNIHTHLSETLKENEDCQELYDVSPTELMEQVGIFHRKTNAAHGVWLSDNDMEILAKYNVSVSHNPVSNLKLASGIAEVEKLKQFGVNVSIGTDGTASNNNLDMFEEIKLAAILQKGLTLDPEIFPAIEVLEMAVTNGYNALGIENSGSVEVGKYADIILVDFDKPHLTPNFNTVSNLVYSANGADVDTVMVRGKILMENRELKTLDEEKILANFRKKAYNLLDKNKCRS